MREEGKKSNPEQEGLEISAIEEKKETAKTFENPNDKQKEANSMTEVSIDIPADVIEETEGHKNQILEDIEVEPTPLSKSLESSESFIKKHNPKILIFVAILLAASLIFITISQAMVRINPVYRTYYGMKHIYEQEEIAMAMSLTMEVDDFPMFEEIFENIAINFIVNGEILSEDWIFAITSEFQEEPLLDVIFRVEEDIAYMDIPQVFKDDDEYYYYDASDLIDNFKDDVVDPDELKEDMEMIKEYIRMVDYSELDIQQYTEAIYEELEKHIESDFNSVTYHITQNTVVDIYRAIIDVAEDDSELYDWIIETLDDIMVKMIEDEFEMTYLEIYTEDIEEAYEDFQDEFFEEGSDKEKRDQWEELLEEAEDSLDMLDDLYSEEPYSTFEMDYDVTYYFDLLNHIEAIDYHIEIGSMADMSLHIQNNVRYDMSKDLTSDDGDDVTNMVNEGDFSFMEDIMEDIVEYFEDYMDDNDDFEDFIEDIEEMDSSYNDDVMFPLMDILEGNKEIY